MPSDVAADQRVTSWVAGFTGIAITSARPAMAKSGDDTAANGDGTEAKADNTEDLQNEIADGLRHVQASIATLKAAHGKTKRLEAGCQAIVKERDTAYRAVSTRSRAKALGKVFVKLNKLVIEGLSEVNAANPGGGDGGAGNADQSGQQVEAGLKELDKIVASLNAMHADASDAAAKRKTLGDQRDGARQIQDDGARARALEQLAHRVTESVADARAMLKGTADAKPVVSDEQVAAADRTAQDLMKQLREQIAKAKQSGMDVKQMDGEQPELEKARADAHKLEGNAAIARALSALQARLNGELRHAHALTDAAAGVMGGQKGPPNDEQKSKIYQAALEMGYGLKIKPPEDMKNAHFDQVFDMLGTVPPAHGMNNKLKQLKYDAKKKGADYDDDTNTITMGNIKPDSIDEYEIGGKKVKTNAFNITTLHEIGHSVDAAHGLMDKNMNKKGCGGWTQLDEGKLVDLFVGLFRQTKHMGHAVSDDTLRQVIGDTLKHDKYEQPAKIHDKEWDEISEWLSNHILEARSKRRPWDNPPEAIGGLVYQEGLADDNSSVWYSYDVGARPATSVSKYQWRSPYEWFAELYAITWLTKKPPPGGVDGTVAKLMWQPK